MTEALEHVRILCGAMDRVTSGGTRPPFDPVNLKLLKTMAGFLLKLLKKQLILVYNP